MAVVGVQPPDRFPLLFYRENPADIHLTIEDAKELPLAEARALSLSGTALSRGGAYDVSLYLAEQASLQGVLPHSWILICGLISGRIPPLLACICGARCRLCDVIIGTEEEFTRRFRRRRKRSWPAKA